VLSSGAVFGGSSFLINGNVAVRKGSVKVEGIPDADGNKSDFVAPKSGCSFTVDGVMASTGAIATSSNIVASEGMYARAAAIKEASVGRLKTAPKEVDIGDTKPVEMRIHDTGSIIKSIIKEFEEIKKKTVFNLRSKAYTIWEPLCSKFSNMLKVSVAMGNKQNYIYPGDDFWRAKGMISYNTKYDKEYSPDQTYEMTGAVNLNLNTSNAEESTK
jgi:hypothetical protein